MVKTVLGSHFGVGEFTTHVRTYFGGDWDNHWGCGILTHGRISNVFLLAKVKSQELVALDGQRGLGGSFG